MGVFVLIFIFILIFIFFLFSVGSTLRGGIASHPLSLTISAHPKQCASAGAGLPDQT
jgi:hypothetical protein